MEPAFPHFPGQGGLDVPGFVRAVLASGYAGPLSLEVFNDDFRSAPARLNARDGLRSLILAEAEAGGGAGLPPVPALDGVEFLEFAVDGVAGGDLAALLGSLGFRHAGRHRSKAVDLYRQGGINMVLNREQDSAAAEHFQQHGPSVCAMALRVDDVPSTLTRAEALLCPRWQERVGAGECEIPAVRAPDGTLVYLVEAGQPSWEDDFDLLPGADGPAAVTGIDHIVQALPAGRMDGFVLFWRAVFGLLPQPQLETPDPYGLALSRALVSPGGRVRLALNASDSRGTATGRFVSTAGAGVHHIALSAPDIGRAASAWGPWAPRCCRRRRTTTTTWPPAGAWTMRRWRTCSAMPCCMTMTAPAGSGTCTPTSSGNASSSRSCSAATAMPGSARPTPPSAWRRKPGSTRRRPC